MIDQCFVCEAALFEGDRFCRTCGTPRPFPARTCSAAARVTSNRGLSQAYVTSQLKEADPYRRVSGPLVEALAQGVSAKATTLPHDSNLRWALLALISLPIWLIIILLSPFDAYTAAKAMSKQAG
ncbi:MAG: hypothetical protein ACRD9R_17935 [Pyrinomonadaceae bacterium]